MKRRSNKPSAQLPAVLKETSTIINAAALQDHLMRSMALHTLPRTSNSFTRLRSQQPQQPQQSHSDLKAELWKEFQSSIYDGTKLIGPDPAKVAPSNRPAVLARERQDYRRVWVCETCTFENDELSCTNQEERCGGCGFIRHKKPHRTRVTLAQQRGLVQAPPSKLTRDEWERCESQALERGDAHHPCSICREPFGVQEQVILSCSHIFHMSCIQSFERFLRSKQHVCPLCRKENYEKRMTSKAAGIHREKCAVLIQVALCRGRLARKRVEALWHDFYRRGKGDAVRRRLFLANRVGKTTDRLVSAMLARDDSIDSLLAEFDKTISLSRGMFDQPQTNSADQPHKTSTGPNWTAIFMKAHARDDKECPICINSFSLSMADVSLLSCSHSFHHECLRAFEDFNIYEIPLCPVCRASYQARHWIEVKASVNRY